MSLYAVIMAGGSGTRLWPLSRADRPKFLLRIGGRKSFIEETVGRLAPLVPRSRLRIVCGRAHWRPIRREIPRLTRGNFIVEPAGRNTAPCIGLAASLLLKQDREAILVVVPADHLVEKEAVFRKTIAKAVSFASRRNVLVTIGVHPGSPHTGYGYIERGEEGKGGAFKVKRFLEKPNRPAALRFLRSRRFYWNAGIFVGHASLFLREIRRFMPELYRGLVRIGEGQGREKIYRRLENRSIDYGVMEKSDRVWVVPGDFGWRDVGDLEEFSGVAGRSARAGRQVSIDSRNVTVFGDKAVVALLGVKDLLVVDTGDVLMIAEKKKAQELRKVVARLRELGLRRFL